MRASDLHALRWGSVDTDGWQWCLVSRPKTDGAGDEPKRLLLEPEAAAVLKEYYLSQGRPDPRKHVFGRQRDRHEGEGDVGGRLSRGSSYARRLRRHLRLAGVTRHELHNDVAADADGTGGSKRADFHSFRRLFCTSLAAANVNIQQAMELAGHRRAETAMRYVKLARRVMAAPAASRPKRSGADTATDTPSGPKPPADTADTASGAGA
jgi:integrase